MSHSEKESPANRRQKYETRDINPRAVALAAIGIIASCGLIFLSVVFFHHVLANRMNGPNSASASNGTSGESPVFPEPRLQITPQTDLAAFRTGEDEELNRYAWIDKQAGIVRIPVTRAMDLIAARGLPVRGQAGAPEPTRTVLQMQQEHTKEKTAPPPPLQ